MKKRVSKLTLYLLTIIMVTSIIPVGMTTATAYSIPNESEFISKINELQTRYPANSKYSGYYYENGVQEAASCHGYAFEIAYNVFGSTMYTRGGGWNEIYSLGNVYAGDVIQFYIGSDTHTIFVTKVEGDLIYFTDANWDWNNGIRWNECFSKSYIESKFCKKWHISGNYLTGNGSMPVSNAWISIKETTIISGEYQTFNFGADNSSGTYTLGIDYEGTRIFTEDLKGNSYSTLFTTPGNFSAYITAYGEGGHVDSNKVYFKVVKRAPATNAWIKADETCIVKTQSITFTYGADDSAGLYTIGIDKDNTRIYTDTTSNNTYTYTFNESGQYSVYVTCYGYDGSDDTEKLYITVNEPLSATNAWIKADKTKIVKGQSLTFTYGADNSAGLYTIGIDKDNTRIYTDTISNNTYTYTFNESGQYSVYVTCYGYGGSNDTEKLYITVNEPVSATNAWIKADKTKIVKGQSVTFTYGADNSAGLYTIGIDKDNERIYTETIRNNTFTYTFNEMGEYSIYVTCYGYAGYDDTDKIFVTVNDTYQTGDVNCDGVVSIADATELQKHLANIIDFNDEQLAVADTNGDGSVSIADATQIQKYLAQLIPSLG